VSNTNDGEKMPEALSRQLGRVFVVMIVTILCLGVIVFWVVEGPMVEHHCEHEYLPALGAALGFRTGRIPVRDYPEGPLGIIQVDPHGPMYATGFRTGDIPLDHHGGMMAFCGAFQGAAFGQDARIVVTTVEYWPGSEPTPRELVVPKPPERQAEQGVRQ
jgi:hypothetical protein